MIHKLPNTDEHIRKISAAFQESVRSFYERSADNPAELKKTEAGFLLVLAAISLLIGLPTLSFGGWIFLIIGVPCLLLGLSYLKKGRAAKEDDTQENASQ